MNIVVKSIFILTLVSCLVEQVNANNTSLQLLSPAFKNGGVIPIIYSCRGKNISVPLKWENVPVNTESFALIMADKDAPNGIWYHWVLFNIPPQVRELKENISKLIRSEIMGLNSWGRFRYDGPCPPAGRHHYVWDLYALNMQIHLNETATAATVLKNIQGHVIEKAELIGTFDAN